MVQKHKTEEVTQPYLLAFTADGQVSIPMQIFLILDYEKIEISGNITKALETLFMSFYAFNLEYPSCLCNMYQVLELLFGLKKRGSKGASNAGSQNVYINLKRRMDAVTDCSI